jgi:hypothetical protein
LQQEVYSATVDLPLNLRLSTPQTAWHLATHNKHHVDIRILTLQGMGKRNLQLGDNSTQFPFPCGEHILYKLLEINSILRCSRKYRLPLGMWLVKNKIKQNKINKKIKAFLYSFFTFVQLSFFLALP